MEYTSQVKNRLKRVEGQVRGVLRMMDEEKECKDVISQLSAARSALDRAIALIVAENLQVCVKEQYENGEESSDVVQEAIQLLVKSR
ncbi:metal-sensitive transcriptional regulator [Cerasibacillus terrae]|uniref:Metal-sensitive transcriptional regulator n=1 Tax=Cerasibacillus terrae TaxID=2498845 RepID=A0A5C8P3G2_9BACI|nr:metal-sensitive transcriptional regulator [Cerasibacillus terrae]TXL67797.1 metal-sensitive transcriptional regulator [Cerasibacillus terrae]